MKGILNQCADKIIKLWMSIYNRENRSSIHPQIEKELSAMNPGKETGKLVYSYYQEKIVQLLLVLAAGIVFLIFAIISSYNSSAIQEQYFISRNEEGAGEKDVSLKAVVEKEAYQVGLTVEERKYTKEEADQLLQEVLDALPDRILGENPSLDRITADMTLPVSFSDFPVSLRWESSRYEVLQDNGGYGDSEIAKTGEEVTLHVTVFYEEYQKERDIQVIVFPKVLSPHEKMLQKILNQLSKAQENTKTSLLLELPKNLEGKTIQWKEDKVSPALIVLLGMILAAVGIFLGRDREIHKKYLARENALLLEYPEFVSKLQLLTGSGMTLSGAFIKMGNDYKKSKLEGGKIKYVYEEILLTNRKMEGGLSETEGYDFFGKRCELLCYRRLCALLIQNLKKGSDGLKTALSGEARAAFEERKQKARRMGEEAGTKLLFPMMLMMGVVMLIIMIPAYLSFGGA